MCLWEICGGVCCHGDDLCPVLTGLESGPHADGEERQSGGSQAQPGGRTGQGDSYSPSHSAGFVLYTQECFFHKPFH